MIKIQKLDRANKRSGHELAPNFSTKVKGVVITNTNSYSVWVDRQAPRRRKKK